MTDRELLEKAAKAAGIDFEWLDDELMVHRATGQRWSSLDDDGDAIRLAVMLEMLVDFMDSRVIAGENIPEIVIDFEDGDYRRAITRAAAAIGETK